MAIRRPEVTIFEHGSIRKTFKKQIEIRMTKALYEEILRKEEILGIQRHVNRLGFQMNSLNGEVLGRDTAFNVLMMVDEEEVAITYFKILSNHLHGVSEETTKYMSGDNRSSPSDSNPALPEYKAVFILLLLLLLLLLLVTALLLPTSTNMRCPKNHETQSLEADILLLQYRNFNLPCPVATSCNYNLICTINVASNFELRDVEPPHITATTAV
jgi:hypothetical protein